MHSSSRLLPFAVQPANLTALRMLPPDTCTVLHLPAVFCAAALHSYCILGDGCMMEGISNEACSLAGHWGLGKLIALYDDNNISIDGHTEISFTEDVAARFEALGWHVQHVKDGNTDFDGLRKVGGCAAALPVDRGCTPENHAVARGRCGSSRSRV